MTFYRVRIVPVVSSYRHNHDHKGILYYLALYIIYHISLSLLVMYNYAGGRRLRCCRGSGLLCRGWWSAGRRPRSQNYSWSPQMATMPNPCVGVCVSVSRVPTGTMEGCRCRPTTGGGWLRRRPPFFLLHGSEGVLRLRWYGCGWKRWLAAAVLSES